MAELQAEGVLLVEDGNHGEYRPRTTEFCSLGTAFIRASDIDDGRVLFHSASQIDDNALARIRKGVGRPGDVLFSHKGTVGKLALVPSDAPPFVCSPQTTFWRTLNTDVLDRRFLYFFMESNSFREQWEARKGETDMADYVSLTAQRELIVEVPPIKEQRAIAGVLGALDDKVEMNRQTNHTLEEMSSAIFKSWFIDFDPIVAKAEGRRPCGMNPATAALFPSRLDDSELGATPLGWPVVRLGDTLTLKRGYDLPAAARRSGAVPIVSSSGVTGTHDSVQVCGPGVVTGRYGTIGQVFFVHEDFWPLNTTLYVKDFKGGPPLFAFHRLKLLDFDTFAGKSAVPGINRNDVHHERVVEPPPHIKEAFALMVGPWMELVRANDVENQTLTALRDILLPRILSGDVRLKQAETLVEAAL